MPGEFWWGSKSLVPNSPFKGYTAIGTGGSRRAKLSKQMERERLDLTELSCLCSVIRSSHYVQSENGLWDVLPERLHQYNKKGLQIRKRNIDSLAKSICFFSESNNFVFDRMPSKQTQSKFFSKLRLVMSWAFLWKKIFSYRFTTHLHRVKVTKMHTTNKH